MFQIRGEGGTRDNPCFLPQKVSTRPSHVRRCSSVTVVTGQSDDRSGQSAMTDNCGRCQTESNSRTYHPNVLDMDPSVFVKAKTQGTEKRQERPLGFKRYPAGE